MLNTLSFRGDLCVKNTLRPLQPPLELCEILQELCRNMGTCQLVLIYVLLSKAIKKKGEYLISLDLAHFLHLLFHTSDLQDGFLWASSYCRLH